MPNTEDLDIPASIATELEDSTDRQLRDIISYARHLLKDRRTETAGIEPRDEYEEIVSIDEKDGHSLVVVEDEAVPDEQMLYRVSYETKPDGEGSYHWEYLGPVSD